MIVMMMTDDYNESYDESLNDGKDLVDNGRWRREDQLGAGKPPFLSRVRPSHCISICVACLVSLYFHAYLYLY